MEKEEQAARAVATQRLPRLALVMIWAAAFVLVLEFPVALIGSRIQNPYARPERAAVLRAWKELGGRGCDVLFIGDSRAGAAFTPSVMEAEAKRAGVTLRAFNLSGPSSTVLSDAGILDYVIDEGARPSLVIWGLGKRQASLLDLGLFQRNEATFGLVSDLSLRAPDWYNVCTWGFYATGGIRQIMQVPCQLLPQYRNELAAARRNRGIGWADESSNWGREYNKTKMPNSPQTNKQWQEAVAHLSKEKNAVAPFTREPLVAEAMQFAVERVRSVGGQVVFVNMPLLSGRTAVEREHGYDDYLTWLSRRAKAQEVRLVDLNTEKGRPADSAFKDTDHLGPQGAEKLTRRVTRGIILPHLRAGGSARQ
ncbi:MAG: hypothetical protein ACYC63_04480 [Armatimonadota bacterium]